MPELSNGSGIDLLPWGYPAIFDCIPLLKEPTVAGKLARRDHFVGTGPARYKIQAGKDGVNSVLLAIDYSDAPVPPHYYVADYYEVTNLDPRILLTFGKLNYPDTSTLRSKLEIDFPAQLFLMQLWKSREEFHKLLRVNVEQFGYEPVPAGSNSKAVEKIQTIHSNNVLMIMSGAECMMDFFYLSPRDMALKTAKSEDIFLEPLVRIITAPNLLLGFLDACEPVAEALRPKFGKLEAEYATLES
jgi:hypothetical protein